MRTLVWFRGKDLRIADHAPLRDALRGRRGDPAVRARSRLLRARARARELPHRMQFLLESLRALEASARASAARACWSSPARACEVVPRLARELARRSRGRAPLGRAVRARARPARARRARRAVRAVRGRDAAAARHAAHRRGHAVRGVQPLRARVRRGRRTIGAPAAARRVAAAAAARTSRSRDACRSRRCERARHRAQPAHPARRRARGARRGCGASCAGPARDYDSAARSPGSRGHQPALGRPQVRHALGRARCGRAVERRARRHAGGRVVPERARLARVHAQHAVGPARAAARSRSGATSRGFPWRTTTSGWQRVGRRPDRLSGGRRRGAPAARRGLRAQPRAHDLRRAS